MIVVRPTLPDRHGTGRLRDSRKSGALRQNVLRLRSAYPVRRELPTGGLCDTEYGAPDLSLSIQIGRVMPSNWPFPIVCAASIPCITGQAVARRVKNSRGPAVVSKQSTKAFSAADVPASPLEGKDHPQRPQPGLLFGARLDARGRVPSL